MKPIKQYFFSILLGVFVLQLNAQRTPDTIDRLIQNITVESYKSHFDSLRTNQFCNRKVTVGLKQNNDHDACRDYIYRTFQKYLGKENCYQHHFEAGKHKGLCNVLGFKKGSRANAKIWVISAHYDTNNNFEQNSSEPLIAPGANDNGTGLSAILEIARVIANVETESSILFAAWDFEEMFTNGYPTGSSEWYSSHVNKKKKTDWENLATGGKINRSDIIGNINFDMFGNPQEIQNGKPVLWACYAMNSHIDFVEDYAETINTFVKQIKAVPHGRLILSDHYTFASKKIQAVENLESSYEKDPHYHTNSDYYENKNNIDFIFATNVTQGGFAYILKQTLAQQELNSKQTPQKENFLFVENPFFYTFDLQEIKSHLVIYDQFGKKYNLSAPNRIEFAPPFNGIYTIHSTSNGTNSRNMISLKQKEGLF